MTSSGHGASGVPRAWRRATLPRLSGTALLARRIVARYGRAVRRVEQLQLLMARPAATTLVQRFSGRTENHFGVTLPTLVVRIETGAEFVPQAAAAQAAVTHGADARMAMPSGDGAPSPWPALARPVVTARTLPPAAAVQVAAGSDTTMPLRPSSPPALASVPAVRADDAMPSVRPRAIPAPPASPPATQASISSPPAGEPRLSATAPSSTPDVLPPHQVERIAELVIGSLDRRILAERERRGGF